MSCDFAIWLPSKEITPANAPNVYQQLGKANNHLLTDSLKVEAFYQELISLHPEIDTLEDDQIDNTDLCPWSCAIDKSPKYLMIAAVWSKAEYVQNLLLTLAKKHQLALYDPQTNYYFDPINTIPKKSSQGSLIWGFFKFLAVAGLAIKLLSNAPAITQLLSPNHSPKPAPFTVTASPTPKISASTSPSPVISNDATFPHELLPGFNLKVPQGWTTSIKQFNQPENKDFSSVYFPTCHERCMGMKLTKGSIGVELTFNIAFDDNGHTCSSDIKAVAVNNKWYRVNYQGKQFYTYSVTEKNSETCFQGTGSFLVEGSSVAEPEGPGTKAPIMLEDPRIIGEPNATELKEIDRIITSITGVES